MELIFQYVSKRLCLMQSSIADCTGQFLQYYRTIKMMQHEYRISNIRAKQHDGEQIYLWETLAEYLTEQRGIGTKKPGRCFPVSLRLMSVQQVQMCARDSSVQRSLSELSCLQSLAELLQKTHRTAGVLFFQLYLCA